MGNKKRPEVNHRLESLKETKVERGARKEAVENAGHDHLEPDSDDDRGGEVRNRAHEIVAITGTLSEVNKRRDQIYIRVQKALGSDNPFVVQDDLLLKGAMKLARAELETGVSFDNLSKYELGEKLADAMSAVAHAALEKGKGRTRAKEE